MYSSEFWHLKRRRRPSCYCYKITHCVTRKICIGIIEEKSRIHQKFGMSSISTSVIVISIMYFVSFLLQENINVVGNRYAFVRQIKNFRPDIPDQLMHNQTFESKVSEKEETFFFVLFLF